MSKLKKIKAQALALYKNNQIPSHLCLRINELKGLEDVSYVSCLMTLTEKFMRVKGYYAKYPSDIKIANEIIDKAINDFNSSKVPKREERSVK